MNEDLLERTVAGFWHNEYDVLVCTTIVENGLDISNANTLIVERSDTLGLSQLHQLRGRVGRGRERGYAYFLFPPEHPLTETAHDRLATIAQHSELGSGAAVAMKDLEIRGAGNILGAEQSGHIAGVGFDLYIRLVGEAVAAFRQQAGAGEGEAEESLTEVRVDLPVDAHVPHDYVTGERLRLEVYRKIAEAGDQAALDAIVEELVDRYGEPPAAVRNLLAVAAFRPDLPGAGRRRGRRDRQPGPDRPGGPARLRPAAAQAAAPQGHLQGRGPSGAGAQAGRGRPDRRGAAARRRAAGVVREAAARPAGHPTGAGRSRPGVGSGPRPRPAVPDRPAGGVATPGAPVTEHAATGRWRASAALLPGMHLPTGAGQPRSTAEFLHRSAQSYAALGRAAIGVLAALIAPFAGPPVGVRSPRRCRPR
jgi:hypothetical protein